MTVPASLLTLLTSDDPPIELVGLLIAEDEKPGLAIERWLVTLDGISAPLKDVTGRGALGRPALFGPAAAGHAQLAAELLARHLYEDLGFRGNHEDYYDPRNCYLDDVLRRRTGIPLTLAVVWIAVGRRIGLDVQGIGFPGHFLVRVGGPSGVIVDPFAGSVLAPKQVEELGARLGRRRAVVADQLRPVGSRAMAVRMLANLKNAHERRGDTARALLACDRLVDLTGAPEFRRDRGLHALSLGAVEVAREDLAAYLECRPHARDFVAVRQARDRAEQGGARLLQ